MYMFIQRVSIYVYLHTGVVRRDSKLSSLELIFIFIFSRVSIYMFMYRYSAQGSLAVFRRIATPPLINVSPMCLSIHIGMVRTISRAGDTVRTISRARDTVRTIPIYMNGHIRDTSSVELIFTYSCTELKKYLMNA